MPKKTITTIGIEHDPFSIRGALVHQSVLHADAVIEIHALEEVRGDFSSDKSLIDGIKSLKSQLGSADRYVTCISGKQVYAAQTRFRHLPEEELRGALRLEMRKTLPFEISGSILEFQYLKAPDKKADKVDLLVTVVAGELMTKHLAIYDRAGIKPDIVDLLPTALANALWNSRSGAVEHGTVSVVLHIGATACTLVFDGEGATFFSRSIPIAIAELFGSTTQAGRTDSRFKLDSLIDEVVRSLSFYEKTYRVAAFSELFLIGEYLENRDFVSTLAAGIGLPLLPATDLKSLGYTAAVPQGKYDVAIALAMRQE